MLRFAYRLATLLVIAGGVIVAPVADAQSPPALLQHIASRHDGCLQFGPGYSNAGGPAPVSGCPPTAQWPTSNFTIWSASLSVSSTDPKSQVMIGLLGQYATL